MLLPNLENRLARWGRRAARSLGQVAFWSAAYLHLFDGLQSVFQGAGAARTGPAVRPRRGPKPGSSGSSGLPASAL